MSSRSTATVIRQRFDALPAWVVDVALAVAAVVTGLGSTAATSAGRVQYDPRDGWAFLLIAVATLPLVFRSRAPLAVLVVTASAVVVLSASGYSEGVLPLWLLVTAATIGSRRSLRQVGIAASVIVFELVVLLLAGANDFGFSQFLVQLALFSTAFALGFSAQARRQRMVAIEQRAEALEAGRAEEAARAVADERLRIAQELHDVMAHTMSVIAVQAGTGAHVIDTDPSEAKRALENIAAASRSSLTELRRMVGVLRDADGAKAYSPQPGLADLSRLVDDVVSAGLPVDLQVEGKLVGVPPGAELAAYRIVQEALTNVLKHAGPARARVLLASEPGAVRVEVTDDGRGAANHGAGTGHGLLGMRERVAVYGGTLVAGPRQGGGFGVVARLPYQDGRR